MTLEDFFTLTEMKNGLTTCARIEELIYMMQKQNCITNNVGDAARQWSTAANTLALTQNRECLDHFVHLNGLRFLNYWLQEAVKCNKDVADGEELINTLLGSLDKLPMKPEKLIMSGIFTTVEKLVCHLNVNIKERAQLLTEKWKTYDGNCQEMDKGCSYTFNSSRPSSDTASIEVHPTVEEEVGNEGRCRINSDMLQNLQIINDNDIQLGDADGIKGSSCNQTSQVFSLTENERHTSPSTTSESDTFQENFSTGVAFSTTPGSPEMHAKGDGKCSIAARNDVKSELNKGKGDSWDFKETSKVSASGLTVTSYTKSPTVVRSASCNLELKVGKSNLSNNTEIFHRCASVDALWEDYLKKEKEQKLDENDLTDLLDLPIQGRSWREEAAENTSDVERCNELTSKACRGVDRLNYETSSVQITPKIGNNSDSGLESGEIDALEIARQVAIQVEREVVDYREELCSSPDVSSNEILNTKSPSIEPDEHGQPKPGEENGNVSVPIRDDCKFTSSPKDNNHMVSEVASDLSKQDQKLETPNGAAVIHKSSCRTKIGNLDFDLNEDACTEDIDCAVNPINLSAPIAVFASKGAPGFLISPLCFEGELGWRGSAATSAFRPASPRRIMNGEKTESGLNHKANLIGIDLNVSGSENYLPVDTASMKNIPVSSGMPSWNSVSEVSSLRAERIKLDLNSNGEEEATPSQLSFIKHHFLNGDLSSSPVSSPPQPPPPRQSSRKNFDLNDNLFLSGAAVSNNVFGDRTDDHVVTVMGSTMFLEGRVPTNQARQSYMGDGLSFDATLATRPMLPYSHQIAHPSFGYIGTAAGMALPFQPAAYGFGNIQQMDSRGPTAFPQLLSSAGAVSAALAPPFLMSITSTPSSSSGGGPSHSGLDLNFGMIQMESRTVEERNLKHPFVLGPHSLTNEHIKTASVQGTSGNSLKRKEPDCGWEPYSFDYKHATSWL